MNATPLTDAHPGRTLSVRRAAARCRLAWIKCPHMAELDVTHFVLDEKATLRRVALFAHGSGSFRLSQDERDEAVLHLRARAEVEDPNLRID